MTTDTTERGFETLIMRHMTGVDGLPRPPHIVAEDREPYGGTGYVAGRGSDYDRAHALDIAHLFAFLRSTQPAAFSKLGMADPADTKDINRLKFLARLSAEVGKRGVIDVLRKGVDHGPVHLALFYGTPSEGNAAAQALHAMNRFSVTRQLAYSSDETRRSLDLCLFINGLPIATFELKNSLTKQNVEDAVEQYKRDRDPRERLFEFGRCVVHFAVDDSDVQMCTELKGKTSWFLPFNKGHNAGAGNPPKVFVRTYNFLSAIMPFSHRDWEKLSILLTLLVRKLPPPTDADLAAGILEAIDMDSYRVEKKAVLKIALADEDAAIEPVPTDATGRKPEPELDRLSNILKTFNETFGTLFTDGDRVARRIRDDIAPQVAADAAYQNARENTPHTARMAHDQALGKVMQHLLKDDTQVYKQFVENESFRRFVGDMVYALTNREGAQPPPDAGPSSS